ncbi:MAG: NADH-quinone oxidoreductase subunit NuoE family protein [Ferrimicrobium sp.]
MSRFSGELLHRAEALVALYPDPRSATIPLCHLAQEQDGYVTSDAMVHIAELVGSSAAEVQGTASFYDMLHLEPVGRYLIGICTNIACLLCKGEELLEHAEETLGVAPGGTTSDGLITLEEVECIAHCDKAPAAQVNYRYFGPLDALGFDELVVKLRAGELDEIVPPHGTLVRTPRVAPAPIPLSEIDGMRERSDAELRARQEERP